jgi:hypothetical protein
MEPEGADQLSIAPAAFRGPTRGVAEDAAPPSGTGQGRELVEVLVQVFDLGRARMLDRQVDNHVARLQQRRRVERVQAGRVERDSLAQQPGHLTEERGQVMPGVRQTDDLLPSSLPRPYVRDIHGLLFEAGPALHGAGHAGSGVAARPACAFRTLRQATRRSSLLDIRGARHQPGLRDAYGTGSVV